MAPEPGRNGRVVDGDLAGVDSEEVRTDDLSVTDETLVSASMSASQSLSANTWATVALDAEDYDELGEFDPTTYQFTPIEDGWYHVSAAVRFAVGTGGDALTMRMRDVTAGSDAMVILQQAPDGNSQTVTQSRVIKLTAGNSYELQAKNTNSSDTLEAFGSQTHLNVRRAFR